MRTARAQRGRQAGKPKACQSRLASHPASQAPTSIITECGCGFNAVAKSMVDCDRYDRAAAERINGGDGDGDGKPTLVESPRPARAQEFFPFRKTPVQYEARAAHQPMARCRHRRRRRPSLSRARARASCKQQAAAEQVRLRATLWRGLGPGLSSPSGRHGRAWRASFPFSSFAARQT